MNCPNCGSQLDKVHIFTHVELRYTMELDGAIVHDETLLNSDTEDSPHSIECPICHADITDSDIGNKAAWLWGSADLSERFITIN